MNTPLCSKFRMVVIGYKVSVSYVCAHFRRKADCFYPFGVHLENRLFESTLLSLPYTGSHPKCGHGNRKGRHSSDKVYHSRASFMISTLTFLFSFFFAWWKQTSWRNFFLLSIIIPFHIFFESFFSNKINV